MFNETNHTSGKSLQYKFGAVKVDFDTNDAANESAVSLGAVSAAYERAPQALRDVRHLLPADGVATIDAVLESVNVT
jgi:hypothetical protein